MSIIIVSLLISCCASVVLSECGKCNAKSSVACVSETSFQYCFGDSPDESLTVDCPKGYNCVLSAEICSKTGTPGCISECGKCDQSKRFACMSENTFALCLGTDKPSNITNECPTDKVCSIEFSNFCDTASETAKASCGPNEVAPTEPPETPGGGGEDPKPTDPNEVCKKIGKRGRYPVDGDHTCKNYIYCYFLNNQLVGKEFSCPGSTLFNPTTQTCVSPQTMQCQPKT